MANGLMGSNIRSKGLGLEDGEEGEGEEEGSGLSMLLAAVATVRGMTTLGTTQTVLLL